MKTITATIQGREKQIISVLLLTLVFTILLYSYFLGQTVFKIIAREKLEHQISEARSAVAALEVNYLALKNKVTLNFAYAAGFSDVATTKFISRKVVGKALSLNNEI